MQDKTLGLLIPGFLEVRSRAPSCFSYRAVLTLAAERCVEGLLADAELTGHIVTEP